MIGDTKVIFTFSQGLDAISGYQLSAISYTRMQEFQQYHYFYVMQEIQSWMQLRQPRYASCVSNKQCKRCMWRDETHTLVSLLHSYPPQQKQKKPKATSSHLQGLVCVCVLKIKMMILITSRLSKQWNVPQLRFVGI